MTDMEYFLDKVNYIIELVPETDKIITVGKNYFYAAVKLKHFNKPKDVERDQFRYVDRVVIACGELPRERKAAVKEMMKTDRVYSHIYYISLYQTDGFTCMECPICGISLKFDNDERIREIIRQNSPGNTEPLFMRSMVGTILVGPAHEFYKAIGELSHAFLTRDNLVHSQANTDIMKRAILKYKYTKEEK